MWCRHCQQDVPAVAQWADGPLLCPRCEFALHEPSDRGIDLESLEPAAAATPVVPETPILDEATGQQLRQIGRKLRPPRRKDVPAITSPRLANTSSLAPPAPPRVSPRGRRRVARERATGTGWAISLILTCGLAVLAAGMGSLIWSATAGSTRYWFEALVATLAGEGVLIVGLSWMAARLWENSRRVNRQLCGVDQQLVEIQRTSGELSTARLTSSQAYYQHFHTAVSPSLAVANLRGQIDDLSARMSA